MTSDHLLDAIAFACRAHRHQLRKDGVTPYASHVLRVMTIAATVFRISDATTLAICALHDTIEDTTTDYDDLADRFGTDVADGVAALTKAMQLPEAAREAQYLDHLTHAPWRVVIGKLADIYDNLTDSQHLSAAQRARTIARCTSYLDVLKTHLPPEAAAAFVLTEQRLAATIAACAPS